MLYPLKQTKRFVYCDKHHFFCVLIDSTVFFFFFYLPQIVYSWSINRLLTMEDAYSEEQMGPLVDNMLLKFHILGEGYAQFSSILFQYLLFSSCKRKSSNCSENIFKFAKIVFCRLFSFKNKKSKFGVSQELY